MKTENTANAFMVFREILRQNFERTNWLLLTVIDKLLTERDKLNKVMGMQMESKGNTERRM